MSTRSKGIAALCVLWTGLTCGQGCPDSGTSVGANNPGDTSDTTPTAGPPTDTTAGTGGSSGSGIVDVTIKSFVISPKSVTITAGQTVRWTSYDFTTHTIRSGDPTALDAGSQFESGIIGIGGTYEVKFDTPGTYKYHCKYHFTKPDEHDESIIVVPAK